MIKALIISILFFNNILGLNLAIHDYDNPSASHILDAKIINDGLLDGNCSDWQLGDLNNDDIINVLDIVNLINYILGVSSLSECQYLVSDINGDDNLDVLDVVLIVNGIFGGPEWWLYT